MRDARLEITTGGWFGVELLEDGEYRFRDYFDNIERAAGIVGAWLDGAGKLKETL